MLPLQLKHQINNPMKKLLSLFLMLVCCMAGYAQAVIDPLLSEEMNRRNDDEQIKVIVIMKSQYDRAQLNRQADWFVTKAERREFVVNELKEFATVAQYDLRQSLVEMERNGMVSSPTVLWIANALYFDATKAAIQDLARRNDIEIIGYAMEHNWIPDGEEATPASATREITPNVTQVHADQVWALGYTGEGVVVAVIDTGVNYNHLDLADHLWDGGSDFPHHGWDVYNHDDNPMDDHGHGTHCSGTVCGDGKAGSQTGMAPNATLMCVKCLDATGNGGAQNISEGIQWAVEHGCDMFSMSLGLPNSSIPDRTLLRHTCEAALDAGIVAAIAAGNEGSSQWQYPIPNNVRVPGSCPPPYMDEVQGTNPGDLTCSVCVGAVDYNDAAAYFSSRGPVTWQNTEFGDYPYEPGIGLIRPDVCAPGVDIKSANYQNISGYTTMSGTSMATPCVAGCMALMLSKDINLAPSEVCRILEETALPLASGKSNTYGFGRVDVFQAVEAIQLGAIQYSAFAINDPHGNNNHNLNPGESVMMDLTMENITDEPVSNVSIVLSTEDANVTITDNTVDFPTFAANETLTVENAFAFTANENVPANEKIRFNLEVSVNGEVTGNFNVNVMVYGYRLEYGTTVVLNDDNGDGLLNPGENADLRILIDNRGNELAQMVTGTLSTEYALVILNENEKSFGTIGAELMGYADFNVTLDAAAHADFTIPFTLDLVDANGRHTELNFNYKNACNVIFNLHDSYGDGWQGNYLTIVYSDGTPTEQMTLESGSSISYTRVLTTNSTISLTWHNGDWTQECSFEITYEDGTIIYQNAGGFNGTQTFTINCTGGGGGAPEFCAPIRNLAYELDGQDVILTWEAPENGTPAWYEVYRETELLDLVEELTYRDVHLDEGLYNYCVYAAYDGCQSEFVCIEAEVTLCGPVQNLTHTMTSDLLCTVSWEAPEHPSGLIEYQIFMDGELLGVTNSVNYAFTIPTGEHDINVKAVFEGCEKDSFMHICILDEVQNLSYNLVGNTAIVWWDEIEGVEQYEITVNGQVGPPISDITYTFVVEDGLTTVKVEPVFEGCYTIENEIEICYSKPIENLHFVSMDETGMLHFGWNASENVEYYEVTANGIVSQTTETAFAFPFEVGYNDFCVTVHSIYGCDSELVCLSQNVCAAVDGFDYSYNGSEVTVTWNGDADSYEVRLDGMDAEVVETNAYTATLEGEHSIQVVPLYENCVALAAQFDFEVTNIAPEIRITDVHEGYIAMTWTEVESALAYNLYRDGELIAENLTETIYTDTEMAIDAQHCYAVVSVFEKGISDQSEAACANYFTGLNEADGNVAIFPNPTTDKVTIQCTGMTLIEVYSTEGKLVKRVEVDGNDCQLEDLEHGIYTVRILRGNDIFVRSIIKTH
jgi:subtilisin family serine protease